MQIDSPEAGTSFEAALALRQRWSLGFASRVTDEYRRFLYLAAIAGVEVTPSQYVDEAWHLHLALPHYREIMCGKILGRPLDHRPGTGTPEDEARCERQYEQTLALYERIFEEPAPGDVWPRPAAPEEVEVGWWDDAKRPIVFAAAGAGLLAGFAAHSVGAWSLGNVILGVAFVLGVAGLFEADAGRRRRGNGGGGGSCGGDGASGCCASCGGGCGGGCGGD